MSEYISALHSLRAQLANERADVLRNYMSSGGGASLDTLTRQLADIWAADQAIQEEANIHTVSLGHGSEV